MSVDIQGKHLAFFLKNLSFETLWEHSWSIWSENYELYRRGAEHSKCNGIATRSNRSCQIFQRYFRKTFQSIWSENWCRTSVHSNCNVIGPQLEELMFLKPILAIWSENLLYHYQGAEYGQKPIIPRCRTLKGSQEQDAVFSQPISSQDWVPFQIQKSVILCNYGLWPC